MLLLLFLLFYSLSTLFDRVLVTILEVKHVRQTSLHFHIILLVIIFFSLSFSRVSHWLNFFDYFPGHCSASDAESWRAPCLSVSHSLFICQYVSLLLLSIFSHACLPACLHWFVCTSVRLSTNPYTCSLFCCV